MRLRRHHSPHSSLSIASYLQLLRSLCSGVRMRCRATDCWRFFVWAFCHPFPQGEKGEQAPWTVLPFLSRLPLLSNILGVPTNLLLERLQGVTPLTKTLASLLM